MLPLAPRDLRTLSFVLLGGVLFVSAFVWGLAHLARGERLVTRWHANGRPAERYTRDRVGRAGLGLSWDEFGRLDVAASGMFGEFGRQRELDAAERARYSDPATRAELDLLALRTVIAECTPPGGRAPGSLHELLRPGWFGHGLEGAHVVPSDPWGNGYLYEPETRSRPARVWTLGRDRKPGGSGEDEDLVCEFAGAAPACLWHGTLAGE